MPGFAEMVEMATGRGIDVVKALPEPVQVMERDLFMEKVKALPDEEAYVVRVLKMVTCTRSRQKCTLLLTAVLTGHGNGKNSYYLFFLSYLEIARA